MDCLRTMKSTRGLSYDPSPHSRAARDSLGHISQLSCEPAQPGEGMPLRQTQPARDVPLGGRAALREGPPRGGRVCQTEKSCINQIVPNYLDKSQNKSIIAVWRQRRYLLNLFSVSMFLSIRKPGLKSHNWPIKKIERMQRQFAYWSVKPWPQDPRRYVHDLSQMRRRSAHHRWHADVPRVRSAAEQCDLGAPEHARLRVRRPRTATEGLFKRKAVRP